MLFLAIPFRAAHRSSFPVRFIRDEFLENYDPTIEGNQNRHPDFIVLTLSHSEEYRRAVTVDGETSSVRRLLPHIAHRTDTLIKARSS
jgi:hypothetical protein